MSKSDFTVQCPHCGNTNDFSDEYWNDELVDDSDHTYMECMYCDYPMEIITHATYRLECIESFPHPDDEYESEQEY